MLLAAAAAELIQHSMDVNHAETMAIIRGLELAIQLGIDHVELEGDSQTVVNRLDAVNTDRSPLGHRAVNKALWCNFLVFSLKFGVWFATSSHVMLAEVVHSVADFLNQALLAYGLSSSKRALDAIHPYGYSKERFVWSLISAVGIFCLGSGATIVHGIQNLWTSQPPVHIEYAALAIGGSFLIEGASLLVAISAVRKGAAAEGMKVREYIWRGHDPTAVAVMAEDGAAVTGLAIAVASLVAVNTTGNPIYNPIGSIIVGNLLGMISMVWCWCKIIWLGVKTGLNSFERLHSRRTMQHY